MNYKIYIRAFIRALQMTWRGEKPPPPHPLVTWSQQLAQQVNAVYRAAERSGFDHDARQNLKVRVDGRLMSVETILAAVKYHAEQEYPNLLRNGSHQRILNTVYATNINDRYWVSRLAEVQNLQQPALQSALRQLQSHLDQIPRAQTNS